MKSVTDSASARAAALTIVRRLDDIQRLVKSAPGLVRTATDGHGDSIAFWNSGTPMEYNLSLAQRRLAEIARAYPDALKSRSGKEFRIELPFAK